jgi:hypothetical protein
MQSSLIYFIQLSKNLKQEQKKNIQKGLTSISVKQSIIVQLNSFFSRDEVGRSRWGAAARGRSGQGEHEYYKKKAANINMPKAEEWSLKSGGPRNEP